MNQQQCHFSLSFSRKGRSNTNVRSSQCYCCLLFVPFPSSIRILGISLERCTCTNKTILKLQYIHRHHRLFNCMGWQCCVYSKFTFIRRQFAPKNSKICLNLSILFFHTKITPNVPITNAEFGNSVSVRVFWFVGAVPIKALQMAALLV